MHRFTRSFLTEWRKLNLPFADKTFVVAISGGADSVSLALVLNELRNAKKLNLRFVLAHFNHQLRGEESDEDEKFVKAFAEKFQFELSVKVQTSSSKIENQKGNLEQNARLARYDFLFETAENLNADGVLTAHTLNDQAETFLLNLIRGSGLDGLSGMKPVRNSKVKVQSSNSNAPLAVVNKSQIQLVRPLLKWAKREDTENFCRLNDVEFRDDSMNENLAFRRVRIRKVLLPLLKDFNPKIIETLGKTAELLSESADLLAQNINSIENEGDAENKINTFRTKIGEDKTIEVLMVKDLREMFPAMRRFLVREWLKNKRGDLRRMSSKNLEAVENLILSRKSGNTVELPGDAFILKKNGKLIYEKRTVEKT